MRKEIKKALKIYAVDAAMIFLAFQIILVMG